MSETYRNINAVLDVLEQNDVLVVESDHDHNYRDGDGYAEVTLTLSVPVYEEAPYRGE